MGPFCSAALEEHEWLAVRWSYVRRLRRHTVQNILLLAIIEALKHGLGPLVFPGRNGYPAQTEQDYGIVYHVAYVVSYIYLCIFTAIFVPLFSWWLPSFTSSKSIDAKPGVLDKLNAWAMAFNVVVLPLVIALNGLMYIATVFEALLFVNEPKTTFLQIPNFQDKTLWKVRARLLLGMALSLSIGYGAITVWERTELARIKPWEYALVVIPVQINIGMMIGTKMQMKAEKRAAKRHAALEQRVRLGGITIDILDEKTPAVPSE